MVRQNGFRILQSIGTVINQSLGVKGRQIKSAEKSHFAKVFSFCFCQPDKRTCSCLCLFSFYFLLLNNSSIECSNQFVRDYWTLIPGCKEKSIARFPPLFFPNAFLSPSGFCEEASIEKHCKQILQTLECVCFKRRQQTSGWRWPTAAL